MNNSRRTTYYEGMNPSPLRRAGVLALVVVSVGLRASAQGSDARFAAALDPHDLQVPAQLRALPQRPVPGAAAKPKGPVANDAVWQKVLETVKRDGKYKAGMGGFVPATFSIEDTNGDAKADHQTRGITFLGMINDDEKFEAMGGMMVFMDFKLDPKDGNFHVEQWLFEVDLYGEVQNAGHGVVITTADGKKISATPEKLNPADPKVQAQYDSMLKYWAERQPK